MEKAVTACKHNTRKAVSLTILGKYRLHITADVVKKKLINTVFSVNCLFLWMNLKNLNNNHVLKKQCFQYFRNNLFNLT